MYVYTMERRPRGELDCFLSIDPGIVKLGWCWFHTMDGKVASWRTGTHSSSAAPMSCDYPHLLGVCGEEAIKFVNGLGSLVHWPITEVIIEYPHMGGAFSTGLCCYLTSLIDFLWVRLSVGCITLLPNRIPEWFLKKRGGVNGTMTVNLAKSLMSFEDRICVHEADAFLFGVFVHYDKWKSILKAEARRPEFELVNL